jgi:hypothetical protein
VIGNLSLVFVAGGNLTLSSQSVFKAFVALSVDKPRVDG